MNGPNDGELPRIIWMYWEQGLENAPEIVRQCHASWGRLNPDWQVMMLDKDTVGKYVDLPTVIGRNYERLAIQKRANILRLNLLAKYGGVWADATCLCNQPLDSWIYDYLKSGFFVFRDPGRGRLMSNWFMAAVAGNHLMQSFCEAHNEYWRRNSFPNQQTKFRKQLLRMFRVLIGKHERHQDYWLSFLARRILRIYPYFIMHYHFAYHLKRDKESLKVFQEMPYYGAALAKSLRKRALAKDDSVRETDESSPPVSKLTWKKSLTISTAES